MEKFSYPIGRPHGNGNGASETRNKGYSHGDGNICFRGCGDSSMNIYYFFNGNGCGAGDYGDSGDGYGGGLSTVSSKIRRN